MFLLIHLMYPETRLAGMKFSPYSITYMAGPFISDQHRASFRKFMTKVVAESEKEITLEFQDRVRVGRMFPFEPAQLLVHLFPSKEHVRMSERWFRQWNKKS
jgi:hypothetical protein